MSNFITPEDQYFLKTFNLRINPFRLLGAEEIDLDRVLNLFVMEENKGLSCFSPVNNIIRGDYGTGKTMMLKAVQSFYYSKALMDITEKGKTEFIPVFVNFATLSHFSDPQKIYSKVLKLVFHSMLNVGKEISEIVKSENWFNKFKDWRNRLTKNGIYAEDIRYSELSADTATQTVKGCFEVGGKSGNNFISGLIKYMAENQRTIESTPEIDLTHLHSLFASCFERYCDKVIFLFDEMGEIHDSFFDVTEGSSTSLFEKFINQFRTSPDFIYKVTVYPNTKSDILQESRFGPLIDLSYNINDDHGFARYRAFTYNLINSYLSEAIEEVQFVKPISDYFDFTVFKPWHKYIGAKTRGESASNGDAIEQLCFASNGIVRKFIILTNYSMQIAAKLYRQKKTRAPFVTKRIALNAAADFAGDIYDKHSPVEKETIDKIVFFCKNSRCYKFICPNGSKLIEKLVFRRKQDNLVKVIENALDQKMLVYELDYGFCILQDIPTHYRINSNTHISSSRSFIDSKFIDKVTTISNEDLVSGSNLEGTVLSYMPAEQYGFISYSQSTTALFFHSTNIVNMGGLRSHKEIVKGTVVSFKMDRNHKGPCAGSITIIGTPKSMRPETIEKQSQSTEKHKPAIQPSNPGKSNPPPSRQSHAKRSPNTRQ